MRLQIETSDQVLDYVREHTPPEHSALAELRAETSALPLHLMQVSPEQGNFLQVLVRAIGAKKALEVGVFTGYSIISTALAVGSDGTVTGLEIDQGWVDVATRFAEQAGVADRIDFRVGDALASMTALVDDPQEPGTYDFIFVDADKENYARYVELGLELLRVGGTLLVDNVLWHGALLDSQAQDSETRALRQFNDYVTSLPADIHRSMFPYADGLTMMVKP